MVETRGRQIPLLGGMHPIIEKTELETMIEEKLGGNVITPSQTTYPGMPALLRTCDIFRSSVWRVLENSKPDGYIVGIGLGGVFAFLREFTLDHPPEGLIAVDFNPYVVAAGKFLLSKLAISPDAKTFFSGILAMRGTGYSRKLRRVERFDRDLGTGLQRWEKCFRENSLTNPGYEAEAGLMAPICLDEDFPRIPQLLAEQFSLIKSLVERGKMAVLYADFTNDDLIRAINQLPGFRQRINIIYLTNAIGLYLLGYTSGETKSGGEKFQSLERYDNKLYPPVYVYSPGGAELRCSRSYEQVIQEDMATAVR